MKKKKRKSLYWIFLATLILAIVFLSYQSILRKMGNYLSPSTTVKAEVVIIEGDTTVDAIAVKQAIGFLRTGMAKNIILVVHQVPDGEEIFSLPKDYSLLIYEALIKTGLTTSEFQILSVNVNDPVTLAEAKVVLAHLSKDNINSAILMAKGFHMRRSLLTYRHVGKALNIAISPSPYYVGYKSEIWWLKSDGFRDFFSELLKLFYYVIRGFIPVSSLFTVEI